MFRWFTTIELFAREKEARKDRQLLTLARVTVCLVAAGLAVAGIIKGVAPHLVQ